MIDKIIGFLWGVVCSFIVFDYISGDINIALWAWVILLVVILLTSLVAEVYSFVTDYRAMAETGWSFGKKLYMWASKKWIKEKKNKSY